MHRPAPTVVDVERRLQDLTGGLARGQRPAHRDVEELRGQLSRLPRTDDAIPTWRLTEFDVAVRELVRHALPPDVAPADAVSPSRRRVRSGGLGSATGVDERLVGLRRRVDVLTARVEAGGRPSRETFEQVVDRLVAIRREADSGEVRQIIDQVRALHRRTLATSRPGRASSLTSSRTGRGFWGGRSRSAPSIVGALLSPRSHVATRLLQRPEAQPNFSGWASSRNSYGIAPSASPPPRGRA